MLKFVALALMATAVLAAPSSKIESRLASTLESKGTANVLVQLRERVEPVLDQVSQKSFSTHETRVQAVVNSLRNHAAFTQKGVLAVLAKQQVEHDIFWITNQVYVKNADAQLVAALAQVENVEEITEEFEVKIDPIIVKDFPEEAGILAEWGVENINAPAAWALPGGNNGNGARVGSIDTGALPNHAALSANFVGNNYGWRDFSGSSQVARDGNGHGTHTIGTMVGSVASGVGVAPGASWMACKGLSDAGSGTNAGLINCGQFMACPTLPNGNSPDCTRAPHVVGNSWGGGQGNTFYNSVINTWKTAGIIPVFANGNSGPNCNTANSPADSSAGVISVGATTNGNGLASFSSKGPTSSGNRVSPLISAPGQNVRSAWHTGANAYNTISGTSMATPHVVGVVALLKAHNPNLTYAQVSTILTATTSKAIVGTGRNCGGINESQFPNNAFGHGIVDARAALQRAISGQY